MNCPNENIEMKQVKVETHYGQTVILDQCPTCGGIWFDNLELFKTKQGQAEKIDLVDVDILCSSSQIKKTDLFCPKDNTKLVHFTDRFFPKEIILARCPACSGFWLNRGEFVKYDNYRQSFKKPRELTEEDIQLGKQMMSILAEQKKDHSTEVMMKLGKFLSTPLDSMGRPLEPEKLSSKEALAIELILGILYVIFRFFIRI
jgi:Zn-finger nucleic acid-binding protein